MRELNGIHTVLFDLDGTLVDSSRTIVDSVMHTLDVLGIDPARGPGVQTLIGQPLLDIFVGAYGMDPAQARRGIDIYREHYDSLRQAGTRVYDGVREGLPALGNGGLSLYVATVKPTAIAEKVLCDLGLRAFFHGVAGASMGPERRDKTSIIKHALDRFGLDRDGALMVGDRDQDIHGARVNGLASLAVRYGFGGHEELAAARPDGTVDGFGEIPRLLLNRGADRRSN